MVQFVRMSSQSTSRSLVLPLFLLVLVVSLPAAFSYRKSHGLSSKRLLASEDTSELEREFRRFLALRQLIEENEATTGGTEVPPVAGGENPEIPLDEGAGITEGPQGGKPAQPGVETTEAPKAAETTAAPKEEKTQAPETTKAPEVVTKAPPKVDEVTKKVPTDEEKGQPGDEQTSGGEQGPQIPEYIPRPEETGESDDKCLNDEFHCVKTMKCIPKTSVCDTVVDCDYNEDEKNCAKMSCEEKGMFTCKNKACLPKEARCNGYDECGDNSDEANCLDLSCADRNMFMCGDPKAPPPYRCAYKSMRCDGRNDCGDNSDEMWCELKACGRYRFRCASGLPSCVSGLARCDGKQDCWDNSDEKDCKDYVCQANWFQCQKGSPACIEQSSQCDRKVDCSDMSDENTCTKRACRDNEFKCVSDGMCIHIRRACNGYPDCYDNSDEDGQMCAKLRSGSYYAKKSWRDLLKVFQ